MAETHTTVDELPESADNKMAILRLRSNMRTNLRADRTSKRNVENDAVRIGLGEISKLMSEFENITEKDVSGLATRIKRRKQADDNDLNRLSQAFLQNQENIHTFSMIPGALAVIVKELTGTDSGRQILACECLCNFSLGSDVCCEKVALTAGNYLIMYVESKNQRLALTSLWTLLNLTNCDNSKTLSTLIAQELVPKLLHLLSQENQTSTQEMKDESCKTVGMIVTRGLTLLRSEDEQNIREHIFKMNLVTESQIDLLYKVLFIFQFEMCDADVAKKIVHKLTNFLTISNKDQIPTIMQALRMLGNIFVLHNEALLEFISILRFSNLSVSQFLNSIADSDNALAQHALWIAGNICQSENATVLGYLEFDSFVDNLKMFK